MAIEVQGLEQLNNRLRQLSKEVATPRERQQIARAGAPPIVRASKKIAVKADKDYAFYRKGKKYTIKAGNLRLSIQAFRQRDGDVAIGPKRLKKLTGEVIGGDRKSASGFYAAMHYKSASRYRQNVTEKAVSQSLQKSLNAMDKAVERILKKYE